MKPISLLHRQSGSTLVIALVTLTALALIGATLLDTVGPRYNATQKAIGWSEALYAADAGADYALANCRLSLSSGAWTGWKKYNSGTGTWVTVTSMADATAQLAAGNKIIYDLPSGSHLSGSGEGTTDLWFHVEVDAPASFFINSNQWYRIRSTGYAGLAGLARANSDGPGGQSASNVLRKYDLKTDHFIMRYGDYANAAGTRVAVAPQATRRIEVIVKPNTPFSLAFLAQVPQFERVDLATMRVCGVFQWIFGTTFSMILE